MVMQSDDKGSSGTGDPPATPSNWEEYIGSLPEKQRTVVQKFYDDKNADLLSTVKNTRKERDTFSTQLRDAAKKLEKGSESEQRLTEQANQLDEANRRADFYEEAPGQQCNNPKAAFLIAKAGDHFTKSGLPDWKAIKDAAPQLFGETVVKKPKGKGGAGAGTEDGATPPSVNDWIRKQAGVKTISNE